MYRILIAEDEARLASFVEKGLRKHGFNPTIAEDGEQALSFLASESFDLLLLDIGLPLKDGWTVLSHLRQQQTLPVIIMTAMSDNGNRDRALKLGANEFMTKPFKFSVLLERIQKFLAP
jgi:two-component system, OmpR family, copper resistance phosphate regulon response regulator CusR